MGHSRKNTQHGVNPTRHESQCSICVHARRQEIDVDFVNWMSPTRIAATYRISRDSVRRHAHATGLLAKRQRNVRAALEKIIEQSGDVKVTAATVVSAVSAYARINTVGQWVERTENIDFNQLFERMNPNELDAYAKDGTLPLWFPAKAQQEMKQDAS